MKNPQVPRLNHLGSQRMLTVSFLFRRKIWQLRRIQYRIIIFHYWTARNSFRKLPKVPTECFHGKSSSQRHHPPKQRAAKCINPPPERQKNPPPPKKAHKQACTSPFDIRHRPALWQIINFPPSQPAAAPLEKQTKSSSSPPSLQPLSLSH